MSRPAAQEFNKATKLAAWKRCNGNCEGCGAKLFVGKYDYHHDKEVTFGGEGTLENCLVLCDNCHGPITSRQAAVIAKSNRVRNRHIGMKKPRTITRWRKMNGDPVYASRER